MHGADGTQRHLVVLGEHRLHGRVGRQQVLHDVQTLGAIEVGGLGSQHLQLVGGNGQGEALATVTGGGGAGDPFELDHLGAGPQLLGDEVTGQLATGHVVGGDVGLDLPLGRAAVQGQHRDVGLVGQADGVAHRL
ncbi:hypothetical protein D3C80_1371530 [compost metagenome]